MAESRLRRRCARGAGQEWFAAPLLQEYLASAQTGSRLAILDIGPARSANVDYLSRFRCRLGIADAMPELLALNDDASAQSAESVLADMLPPDPFAGTDLILCWDLLDYLSHQGIRQLASHLRGLGGPGTALHALVAYGVSSMPAQPSGYLLDADGLRSCPTPPGGSVRRPPRHSSGELQRLMPQWRVERSVLLRNGLQEYLLRC
ncbi:hypothetical protein [Aquisalimonas sp.]|uniref:hypothetical protein n=1 Tax=Aquisalimonas sp. TaxID=1872621 RepID=UPI0025C5AAE9|nr:hypothetical protein [Aquisalimonas sp.]